MSPSCGNIALDKILTVAHLIGTDWQMTIVCMLCKEREEIVNHLSWFCRFMRTIWCRFLFQCGMRWVSLDFLIDLLKCWKLGDCAIKRRILWKFSAFVVVWLVWKVRNDKIFNDKNNTLEVVGKKVRQLLVHCASIVKEFKDINTYSMLTNVGKKGILVFFGFCRIVIICGQLYLSLLDLQ